MSFGHQLLRASQRIFFSLNYMATHIMSMSALIRSMSAGALIPAKRGFLTCLPP
jgi:hypothetical protein